MIHSSPSPADPRRRGIAAAVAVPLVLALGFVGGSDVAVAEPALPVGARIEVSPSTVASAGTTITVVGSGFDPGAAIGTRPPFAGQPSGVYVVFGRFAETWQPSAGAPASARQVITQVWALPRAQHDTLDPTGEDPSIVLLHPDGSFTAELVASPSSGSGTYGVATFAGSGAIAQPSERFVAVSVPEDALPTTTLPTTTLPTTTLPTDRIPSSTGSSVSATGAAGQTLTVRPGTGLDPAGQTVAVTGSGYDVGIGVYLALCVDRGRGAVPSPCLGGAATEGSNRTSAWISSDPPSYASGLAVPFGDGGTFSVELDLSARDEHVDCLAVGVRCVLSTRADHTAAADRRADVSVPVRFTGQDPVTVTTDFATSLTVEPSKIVAGGTVAVRATGLAAGEQAKVTIDDRALTAGTVAADGVLDVPLTVPVGTTAGLRRITVTGLTSGRIATGEVLVLDPPAVAGTALQSGAATSNGSRPTGSAAPLAMTGSDVTAAPVGALLVLAGLALVLAAGAIRRPSRIGPR